MSSGTVRVFTTRVRLGPDLVPSVAVAMAGVVVSPLVALLVRYRKGSEGSIRSWSSRRSSSSAKSGAGNIARAPAGT